MQQQEPTSHPSQRTSSSKKRGPRTAHTSQPPQTLPTPRLPASQTPEEWRAHWKAQGQPWRTEPEIDAQRQEELAKHLEIIPHIQKGIYPFRGTKLSRADIEWLLATHENGRGPVDWSDENQRTRQGLDVRGADLRGSGGQGLDLTGLPLARLVGSPSDATKSGVRLIVRGAQPVGAQLERAKLIGTHLEGANLAGAHLEGADLCEVHLEETRMTGTHLEGANLVGAYLKGAKLGQAHLEGADLGVADLKEADLVGADLKEAKLSQAHLEGAKLIGTHLEGANLAGADLKGAKLCGAYLEGANLASVHLGDKDQIGPYLVDIRWGDVNLSAIDWSQVALLGDEQGARQEYHRFGARKARRVSENFVCTVEYLAAVRASRQLSVVLQGQGLNEDAMRFAYRAQILQKTVFWFQMIEDGIPFRKRMRALGRWLFSWFLFVLAGYGYKPLRSFLAYVLVIVGFATIYYLFGIHDLVGPQHMPGPHYLSWYEAIVVSMTAFHGRGFFVGSFSPADPQALVAAIEAFFGLLIEVTFIATLTQRLFSR